MAQTTKTTKTTKTMKNQQEHTVSLIATDRVSIWEWSNKVKVTFEESPGNSVIVEGVDTEEFLRSCVYFIHGLCHTKELARVNHSLLNSILEDLKIWETNEAGKAAAGKVAA
jgi:hypothetical protein